MAILKDLIESTQVTIIKDQKGILVFEGRVGKTGVFNRVRVSAIRGHDLDELLEAHPDLKHSLDALNV